MNDTGLWDVNLAWYSPNWYEYSDLFVFYSTEKQQCRYIKNIICFFSFPLTTQNVRMRTLKTAEIHAGRGRNLQWTAFLFWFWSKPSWLYDISDTSANSCGHNSFNLPPTQHTWSCFLLACYRRNFHDISAGNTNVLFTLSTRWISCHFVPNVRLPQLYRRKGLQVNIQHYKVNLDSVPIPKSYSSFVKFTPMANSMTSQFIVFCLPNLDWPSRFL